LLIAVLNVEEKGRICAISDFAEFVLEKWRKEEKFPELKKQVGKKICI
jgi:hypothetical protein